MAYGYFWFSWFFLVFICFYWFVWDLGFSEDEHGQYYAAPRRVDIPGLELEPGAACNSRELVQPAANCGRGSACNRLRGGTGQPVTD